MAFGSVSQVGADRRRQPLPAALRCRAGAQLHPRRPHHPQPDRGIDRQESSGSRESRSWPVERRWNAGSGRVGAPHRRGIHRFPQAQKRVRGHSDATAKPLAHFRG